MNQHDKDKNKLPVVQAQHLKHEESSVEDARNTLPHNTTMPNNLLDDKGKPTLPDNIHPCADIHKAKNRRSLTLKTFLWGLATQLPIIGGFIIYEKLVRIEEKVDEVLLCDTRKKN